MPSKANLTFLMASIAVCALPSRTGVHGNPKVCPTAYRSVTTEETLSHVERFTLSPLNAGHTRIRGRYWSPGSSAEYCRSGQSLRSAAA